MKTSEKVISAVLTIVLGVLCLIMKSEAVSVAMTILGAVLIVLGALDLLDKNVPFAVVKIVIGVLLIIFGWTIVSAVLYIVAALLMIYGILTLYNCIRFKVKGVRPIDTLIAYAAPVICIVIAFFLFFNQRGTVDWVFIVSGIFLILEGILMLFVPSRKQ